MSRRMDHEGVILRIIPVISNGFVQSHATTMGGEAPHLRRPPNII